MGRTAACAQRAPCVQRGAAEWGAASLWHPQIAPGAGGRLGLEGVDGGRVGDHLDQRGAAAGGQHLRSWSRAGTRPQFSMSSAQLAPRPPAWRFRCMARDKATAGRVRHTRQRPAVPVGPAESAHLKGPQPERQLGLGKDVVEGADELRMEWRWGARLMWQVDVAGERSG